MTVSVAYHSDDYSAARPAVNVKLHARGYDLRSPTVDAGSDDPDDLHAVAYDRTQERFWSDAASVAADLGLGEITTEGRSGGWLVLTDGRDPQEMVEALDYPTRRKAEAKAWLAAYAKLAEWCEAELRAIPARVANLAQQMAMDAVGEPAARRMFAFLAPYPGESYAEIAQRPDAWCIASPDGMGPHRPDGATCAECGTAVAL